MRRRWRVGVPLLVGTLSAMLAGVVLASSATPVFYLFMFAPPTGNPFGTTPTDSFNSFDISWVDNTTGLYYLADRSTGGIDEYSPSTNKYIQTFTGFVGVKGSTNSGPNGVFTATQLDQVWGGDGNSNIRVFDVRNGKQLANIPVGNSGLRADEGAFDPVDNYGLVANDEDTPPFVTIVNAFTFQIVKQIKWDGAPGDGPNAIVGGVNQGLEQPQWYPPLNSWLISTPGSTAHPGGEIDQINPKTFAVTTFSSLNNLTCAPAGLAIDSRNNNVLAGCGTNQTIVLNSSGTVIATIPQIYGSDEVWYNPTTDQYYTASSSAPGGAALGVIDASTNAFVALVKTQSGSHSVAADPITGEIFVPIKDQVVSGNTFPGGVAVFHLFGISG